MLTAVACAELPFFAWTPGKRQTRIHHGLFAETILFGARSHGEGQARSRNAIGILRIGVLFRCAAPAVVGGAPRAADEFLFKPPTLNVANIRAPRRLVPIPRSVSAGAGTQHSAVGKKVIQRCLIATVECAKAALSTSSDGGESHPASGRCAFCLAQSVKWLARPVILLFPVWPHSEVAAARSTHTRRSK